MKLEDLLIMEVPTRQLRHICSINKLKPGGNSTEDYAKCISENTELQPVANLLVDEFQFAGKTTVRLYRPLDAIFEKFNNIHSLREFLRKKYGDKIFTSGIRTEPTDIPRLFKVTEYNEKFYLSFVYLGQERRVFRDYEIVKERPQNVDFLVIHFNPLLLQVRVPTAKDSLFKQAFLKVLDINQNIDWVNVTALDDGEARLMLENLKCGLVCAKHKMTEGIYDTIEVRAKPEVNLADEPEYKDEYNDKPYRNLRGQFQYKYSNGLEDTVSLQVTNEGVNFYTQVSEEVIQHVVNCILSLKFPPNDQVATTTE